ncbi:hypothetical protein SAMN05444487_11526 [Marininema mesophilum]|uniref:Uncharacterized protein n=1 Tax=Marininema mesophilum TaxID=1048340 RepID=A0A1H3B3H2_9BACL|nr:hypothetical protein [Marininema mesophilum]SDX36487.1 hypothetical protein SAMN05444487_11526 [Marininema mesophilum]
METQRYELFDDERLQIKRPLLHVAYEVLTLEEQHRFELLCQEVCAEIPPRIQAFEALYMGYFEELHTAEDDATFYRLMEKMNDLSCRIADLNVLFLYIEGNFILTSTQA